MNISAFLTFRKDYYNIQKRILKKLDGSRLKFDSTGHGEKTLFKMKLRPCKQVVGKTVVEGDEIYNYLNHYSLMFLTFLLSNDSIIKNKIAEKHSDIAQYFIRCDFDEVLVDGKVDGKRDYYIYINIQFSKSNV